MLASVQKRIDEKFHAAKKALLLQKYQHNVATRMMWRNLTTATTSTTAHLTAPKKDVRFRTYYDPISLRWKGWYVSTNGQPVFLVNLSIYDT